MNKFYTTPRATVLGSVKELTRVPKNGSHRAPTPN